MRMSVAKIILQPPSAFVLRSFDRLMDMMYWSTS